MSINGRSNVDIVFHDMDGTSSIKVVELDSSDSQSTGKVVLISGTHDDSTHTLSHNSTGYYDASGTEVSISNVTRIGFRASRPMSLTDSQGNSKTVLVQSDGDRVSLTDASVSGGNLHLIPGYTSGTASYTVFLYGT